MASLNSSISSTDHCFLCQLYPVSWSPSFLTCSSTFASSYLICLWGISARSRSFSEFCYCVWGISSYPQKVKNVWCDGYGWCSRLTTPIIKVLIRNLPHRQRHLHSLKTRLFNILCSWELMVFDKLKNWRQCHFVKFSQKWRSNLLDIYCKIQIAQHDARHWHFVTTQTVFTRSIDLKRKSMQDEDTIVLD